MTRIERIQQLGEQIDALRAERKALMDAERAEHAGRDALRAALDGGTTPQIVHDAHGNAFVAVPLPAVEARPVR